MQGSSPSTGTRLQLLEAAMLQTGQGEKCKELEVPAWKHGQTGNRPPMLVFLEFLVTKMFGFLSVPLVGYKVGLSSRRLLWG